MDYGKLYDEHVADTYDEDALGLLSGVRSLAIEQIARSGLPDEATILDLGVGTGATLAALAAMRPRARLIGIDLSARMIDLARGKVTFEAHVDDACNAGLHVAPSSVDLVVAHFLTTFVDRRRFFGVAAGLLRPGGHLSVVSSPAEAFRQVSSTVDRFLGAATAQTVSPSPENAGVLEDELRSAGLDIDSVETFRRRVRFETFDECVSWGLRSGFFAHAIAAIGMERIQAFAGVPGIFPLEDEYVGVAILATRPDPTPGSGR